MQKGKIGVTTENIFPVIKKFLYSDHEIFLREIVSNGVDATQKLKTLSQKGEAHGELGDLTVSVIIDSDAGTLTIRDRGIGMTAEEIEKYINQIAFSGAEEFLDKYKDDAASIIGHFGLGFYSSFMVSSKVEILTKSYREGAQAVKWSCDGSPEYSIEPAEKADRGTDIILYIDEENKEFLEKSRIEALLNKYCRFLTVPIAFGKKTTWEDGKQVETDEDNIINDTNPLWTRKPSDLTDEDYLNFYRQLYPMSDDPLFWIHLNVDYPFNLTGVLYFPKIKNNIDIQRNKIQLYCNQVFVTEHVENIVPDFLTLLHGVIDSPDIPLNVSRSYLQSDTNVKKISTYITKKVSDKLASLFKTERESYEAKWNDLKLFIHYGMLSQTDFYDKAKSYALLTDTENKKYTYEEYAELIKGEQTAKDEHLVYLYTNDKEAQYGYIEAAKAKGYNVLLMDGQLDSHLVGMLEQKLEKSRFSRVDGDTIDKLIEKADAPTEQLNENERQTLSTLFTSQLPQLDKVNITISIAHQGEQGTPALVTQSEYMRRMKEMSQLQGGMNFYGEMPDMYQVVLNADHTLVQEVLSTAKSQINTTDEEAKLTQLKAKKTAIEQVQQGMKAEDITDAEKQELTSCTEEISTLQEAINQKIAQAAQSLPEVRQMLDLALIQAGLLRGEALNSFIKRSFDLLNK